ncbi:MAG: 5-oxoprolinase subunit PxpA [Gemmataceae bacterium]
MEIDINCDLGEGFPFDAELMALITSANIACGFHAGNAAIAFTTLRLAAKHGVQVGAHPGYADRENFGRREVICSQEQIFEECVYQIGALAGLAQAAGIALRYVKPHGALYNQACREAGYAAPLVKAAELFHLAVMALPDSQLQLGCQDRCPFVAEGFADRRYLADGSLVPRSQDDALLESAQEAVRQAEWLIQSKGVKTLCVHGDNPNALPFVRALRAALYVQGISVRAFAI